MNKLRKRISVLLMTTIIVSNFGGGQALAGVKESNTIKQQENKEDEIKEEKVIYENIVTEEPMVEKVDDEAVKEEEITDENIDSGEPSVEITDEENIKEKVNVDVETSNETMDKSRAIQNIEYNKEVNFTFPSNNYTQSFQFYVSKPGRVELSFNIIRGNSSIKSWKLIKSSNGESLYTGSTYNDINLTKECYLEEGYYNFTFVGQSSDKLILKAIYDDSKVTESEPNNLRDNANTITLGKITTGIFPEGSIDDKDWYKFVVPNAGYVNMEYLNHTNTSFTKFKMYKDDSYEPFINGYIGKDGSYYEPSKSYYDYYLEPGTYYIELGKYRNGKYNLKLDFTSGDTNEKEPNDYSKDANDIKLNEILKGMLGHVDRTDWHKITVPNDMKVNINAKSYDNEYLYVEIYNDPSYNPIHKFNIYDGNASWNEPKQEIRTIDLKKGTYYIKVYGSRYYSKYRLEFNSQSFTDTLGHYAEKEIEEFALKGHLDTSKTEFRPNDSITRAEFVKLVNKNFGFTSKSATENYTDVKKGDWWYNEVLIAMKAGYIDTKKSTFRPNDPITREEVAAIVTSIKNKKDSNLDKIKKYKDYYQVGAWARSSVEGAIEAGYMGKNSDMFNPKKNITRAESIVTLYRIK